MAKTTIVFGLVLIALGVLGYAGAGTGASDAPTAESAAADEGAEQAYDAKPKKSVTALIPAFVGGVILICGFLALHDGLRMHAMHGAVLVGLLGFLAGVGRGGMGLGKFLSGDPSLNERSFLFVWLMALICGVFVVLCVQSFIAVRKRRKAEEAAGAAS